MARPDDDQLLTTPEVAALVQESASAVNKWVKDGHLRAHRTPGGHRRVRVADLVAFLAAQQMPLPRALSRGACVHVLVVESDARAADALRRRSKLLADRLELTLTAHAVDALVMIGALRPRLVVLGQRMGELDGDAVARRLLAMAELRPLDVVVTEERPLDLEALLRRIDV